MAGRKRAESRFDYRIRVRPGRNADVSASRSLRWMLCLRARTFPGATPRISETRVLKVPAVTSVGSALSVTRDNAARPVHDRNGVFSAVCDMERMSGILRILFTMSESQGSRRAWLANANFKSAPYVGCLRETSAVHTT